LTEARLVVEPTGALSLAAYFKAVSGMTEPKLKSGKTVLLISGGNADPELLAQWIKNR
jgi:threonine dehydratase